jgi:molybdate transport system permease protein
MERDAIPTLLLSLKTAGVATLIAFAAGTAAAWLMAGRRFRGKTALDALFLAPLVLPPTVVGFVLLLMIGSRSPIGRAAESMLGQGLLFTWPSAVLAATVVAFPLMYRTARGAFEQIDRNILAAGRTLGAGRSRVFRELGMALAWPGIVAATVLTFARALGEFGATLMVAGNLPGRTRTIPLAIYTDVESGDLHRAGVWVGIIVVITVVVAILANRVTLKAPRLRRQVPARPRVEAPLHPASLSAFTSPGSMHPTLVATIARRLGSFTLDISFSATRPCAIVGASGAGKSLLLRCLSGLETPDAGRIVVNGREVFDGSTGVALTPAQRSVGHVFQSYALFPHLSVFENVAFGLRHLTEEDRAERVWRLLSSAGLDDVADRFPPDLSGGQQQRVAVLRALAIEPQLLLLDEPLSALDSHLRYRLERMLAKAVRDFRGVTLLVTHNLEEAFRICEDLVVLDEGRVVAAGDKHAVFAQPRNLRAAIVTGCKNISRARRQQGLVVVAEDWGGIELVLPADIVPEGPTHVGIRAHQLTLHAEPPPEDTLNAFSCTFLEASETPHRMTVHVQLTEGGGQLQLEMMKDAWGILSGKPQPWTVVLAPNRLMPLREDLVGPAVLA